MNMMDYLPINKRFQSNTPLPPPFIPNEIIVQILCLLPVKTLLQLRCVSKAWKTLISDPAFVQKHLKNSPKSPYLLFTPPIQRYPMKRVKFFSVLRLLESDPSIIVSNDNFHGLRDYCQVVGTYNGLLCLFFHDHYQKYWFCLWNPSTRTLSENFGIFQDRDTILGSCRFTFGCDISTGTYKVVALSKVSEVGTSRKVSVREDDTFSMRYEFKVLSLSLGYNYWRYFQYGSSIPVCLKYWNNKRINNGVHLNGTINWLAFPNYNKPSTANAQRFVIVSFDLSSNICTQFLLPPGLDEVSCSKPALNVLMDCLCFSHDTKRTEFVIWQMKEFGAQKSWTLIFKINYFYIQMYVYPFHISKYLLPLYLSKNGDTCILANNKDDQVVIYNRREKREKRVKGIRIANKLCWLFAMEYVESLVSTC